MWTCSTEIFHHVGKFICRKDPNWGWTVSSGVDRFELCMFSPQLAQPILFPPLSSSSVKRPTGIIPLPCVTISHHTWTAFPSADHMMLYKVWWFHVRGSWCQLEPIYYLTSGEKTSIREEDVRNLPAGRPISRKRVHHVTMMALADRDWGVF